ncbi:MAG: hypothetical protein EOO07_39585 [Chitinophagaceae bacterium]|nr:MAG: hypothetical protein EOO07_39585 [Chitinophagaceae bacterium]
MKEKYVLLKSKQAEKVENHFLLFAWRFIVRIVASLSLFLSISLLFNTGTGKKIMQWMLEPVDTTVDDERMGAGFFFLIIAVLFLIVWNTTSTLIKRNRYIGELESLIENDHSSSKM